MSAGPAGANDADILVVAGAAASYAGGIVALEDVSLRVGRGDVVAILGANGAGKTTLLRAVANLLPAERGRVTRGRILFEGMDATRTSCGALVRAGLASVLEGRHCFASLTLEENLLTGAHAKGLGRARTRESLELVYALFPGLAARRRLLAGQVSGGEQQMTAIGRALMSRPTLLLLDEPSMGLAPLVVRGIFDALMRLNREQGLSLLVAEQNQALARRHAHRIVGLSRGRVRPIEAGSGADANNLYLGEVAAGPADRPAAIEAEGPLVPADG